MTNKDRVQCFFIFGCPRSGTSLLSRMLDSHSELSVPFESHIFKMFWNQRRFYGDLNSKPNQAALIKDILGTLILSYWSPTPSYSKVLTNLHQPGFAGVVDAVMNSYSPIPTRIWGEKTPAHINYWTDIKQCFPEAKLIHLIRDGRDVARSLVSARFGPVTLDMAAQYWKKNIETFAEISKKLDAHEYLQIRYEDLIDKPKQVLSKICDYLSIDYSPEMLEFYSKDVDYPTDSINMGNLRSPVIKNNAFKWKEQLTGTQINTIEQIAGSSLRELGYDLSNNTIVNNHTDNKYVSYLRWAISRAKDTQGQREFVNLKFILLKRRLLYHFSQKFKGN